MQGEITVSIFRGSLRAGVAGFALIAGAVCIASPALAQGGITLAASSLEESLNALSRRTGVQILVDQNLLRGKKAGAIRSASSVGGALSQLLRGSGLTYQKRGDAYLIVRGGDSRRNNGHAAAAALPSPVRETTVADSADGPTEESQIVVTGSRIARPELESAMPVNVVKMDDARALGHLTVFDALKWDPTIFTGVSPTNALGQEYDGGLSTVSLRNLGPNRTLTLLDGMRRVSSSARSSMVDLNAIPPEMVERIEIVTGGAAAVYGADAVTGAVNVITKKHIKGLNLSATTGISQYGDGRQTSLSASFGSEFAGGRGSFAIGGTYNDSSIIFAADRPFSKSLIYLEPNPKDTGPNDGIPDNIFARDMKEFFLAYNPVWYRNGSSYMYDNRTGTVRVPTYDQTWTTGEFSDGSGGNDGRNYKDKAFLRGPVQSVSMLGRIDYKISDSFDFSTRFDYAHTRYEGPYYAFRTDSRQIVVGGYGGEVIRLDNPYLPDAVRTYMLANNLTDIHMGRTYGNLPTIQDIHNRNTYTINPSVTGKVSDQLTLNLFYQFGRSTDHVLGTNQPYLSHWVAARDAIADPVTGTPICRDAAARAAGCVPFNIFTTEPFTQQQLDYILTDRRESRKNTQQIVGGSVQGGILRLPYGMASGVIGAEYRDESLVTRDDPLALAGETAFASSAKSVHPDLDVSSQVYEFYGELVAPLLSDLPFARKLEIEGAYRYSHYNTYGGTDTWKAGGTWQPVSGVTFRAVRSRSIRTPNFGELYEPQNTVPTGVPNDPCGLKNYNLTPTRAANCAALGVKAPLDVYGTGPFTTSGGNPSLRPETSNSLTAGMVLQPRFLKRLDLTVDYWNIDITDVITQFSPTTIYNLCVDLPTIDNLYCKLQTRDSQGHLATLMDTQVNASRMLARGIDFGARWQIPVSTGQIGLSVSGTWLLKNVVYTTPGVKAGDVVNAGGYQNPNFRATLFTTYTDKDWSFSLGTRFTGGAKWDSTISRPDVYESNHIAPYVFNDMSVSRTIDGRFTFLLGVNNVFNTQPPAFPDTQYDSGGYFDVVGRYFFTSVRMKLR